MRSGLATEQTPGGVAFGLPLSTGISMRVEFTVGGDLMHVRYGSHGAAVLDRERLRRWLAAPHGEWDTDEVVFVYEGPRMALILRGLGWWWLTDDAFDALRAAV
jgi:hypothetical protein